MKLSKLTATNYRSIHDATLDLGDLSLFIGANASGKSAILDTLRFLSEAVQSRDFRGPVYSRGGIPNLAWKGQQANQIQLTLVLEDEGKQFEWSVRLTRQTYEFYVEEEVKEYRPGYPPTLLLSTKSGDSKWWSGEKSDWVTLNQLPSGCALGAASADASFPARRIAEFIGRWGFFDPSPFLLRRDWNLADSGRFDPYGRNLGETLYALEKSSPDRFKEVVSATRDILGVPSSLEVRESEDRFYFVQREPGLAYPVHQMGVSSGTLRMLALMTALHAQPETTLIGIEEPENYIHPAALSSFVDHLLDARSHVQLMVTTHSPLLLDIIDDPAAVCIVGRSEGGTTIMRDHDPDGVKKALDASGFGLGEYYETKGFGG